MTQRPIMDAGPAINFFATNKERLLFATLGPLAIPEIVETEIRRKASQDQRFATANQVLSKIPARLLEVLSDNVTDELARAVNRIAGMPIKQRQRTNKDLGETMVIAHAVVAAEQGAHVIVLIDDGDGRRIATQEAARLNRLRINTSTIGSLSLVNTITILKNAAGKEHLPDRASLRELYTRLRKLDDGIPPLERTELLELPIWNSKAE